MNPYSEFTSRVHRIVTDLGRDAVLPTNLPLERIVVEPPRQVGHGDLATNAAMVLAGAAKMKPRDLATLIAKGLEKDPDIADVEIAGPGFINIRLAQAWWPETLKVILQSGDTVGKSESGAGTPVNVEYVSANPTGPLHVGHCRGAVFGDALANLLEHAGYAVTREYYINDAGAQIDTLAKSAYLRYLEARGEDIGDIPDGLYPGDYLIPVGKALDQEFGDSLAKMGEKDRLAIIREKAVAMMMTLIREDLESLDIRHDVFFSEKSLADPDNDRIAAAIDTLREQGAVYTGKLPPPKGKLPDDWEDRDQTLFRSTDFGDDVDRALLKSDGSYTYFASDIAYHLDKYLRGFASQVLVVGADHGGYVKRMTAAVSAITGGKGALDIKLCQLVRLLRDGQPVKMSKRAGEFVTLRDVVEEVGKDPVRFMMLYRKNEAPLDFDFAKVKEQSKDNPVFYVQYAHARAHSVLRNAKAAMPDLDLDPLPLSEADLSLLVDDGETGLIKLMAQYSRTIESAAQAHEPHRVAFYLYELSSAFHSHWNKGKESPQLRFINPDKRALSEARLGLIHGLILVLANGLDILGVDAVREM
jgi:arginyl-tRNA synthetase